MPLKSMTGFARADGSAGLARFHWELRSVNGRGLDVRLRLPSGFESLEAAVREAIAKALVRGNVSATLVVDAAAASGEIRINERALATVLSALDRLAQRGGFERPRPEGVLALRGIIEAGEATASDDEAAKAAVLAALGTGIGGLVAARAAEGARLEAVLLGLVDAIEALVGRIASLPVRQPEAIRARLAELVGKLTGASPALDAGRLHQEAMLVATRADVEEEIKRLEAHIAQARSLVADKAAAGRRLDFLAQEFNREANTICSKSIDIEMTRLGLELKAVIDQLREQVQNIE